MYNCKKTRFYKRVFFAIGFRSGRIGEISVSCREEPFGDPFRTDGMPFCHAAVPALGTEN